MLFTPLCASTNSSKLKIAIILIFIRIFTVACTITVTTFETQKYSGQNYALHSTLPRNHAHVTTSTEPLLANHCRQNHTTSRITVAIAGHVNRLLCKLFGCCTPQQPDHHPTIKPLYFSRLSCSVEYLYNWGSEEKGIHNPSAICKNKQYIKKLSDFPFKITLDHTYQEHYTLVQ
jgi:hypothetical protein